MHVLFINAHDWLIFPLRKCYETNQNRAWLILSILSKHIEDKPWIYYDGGTIAVDLSSCFKKTTSGYSLKE